MASIHRVEDVQIDLAEVVKIDVTKAGPIESRTVKVIIQSGYWFHSYKFYVFNDHPSFKYMKMNAKLRLKVSYSTSSTYI